MRNISKGRPNYADDRPRPIGFDTNGMARAPRDAGGPVFPPRIKYHYALAFLTNFIGLDDGTNCVKMRH
jgi:hypothetical protein